MTESFSCKATGRAAIHSIEGIEIVSTERSLRTDIMRGKEMTDGTERTFIAQLTDTHCRILSETHVENGVKHMHTFLDGGNFLQNWGFGEDNCGNETNLSARGIICKDGDTITAETTDAGIMAGSGLNSCPITSA